MRGMTDSPSRRTNSLLGELALSVLWFLAAIPLSIGLSLLLSRF
jgi:hypothetical protein